MRELADGDPLRGLSTLAGGASKQAGPVKVSRVRVLTHARPEHTHNALERLIDLVRGEDVLLMVDAEEASKHGLRDGEGIRVGPIEREDVDLCFVLGGDGTILKALRVHAGLEAPVFAVNFGEIGFLATVEQNQLTEGVRLALRGEFELLRLPMIALEGEGASQHAVNDVAIHRKIGDRVASISYSFGEDELGSVRCDGLVVATPAGSTGYNLANGGPVMAWGVKGFAVSFIAPHSLTARALVVAPHDQMRIHNRGGNALDVSIDGRPFGELPTGGAISVGFVDGECTLAQLPGSSFYRRLSEKFGRLAR
ncbi:MAG: NAD(+)/NADH kinase [Solirubrobacteraceae bacterium]